MARKTDDTVKSEADSVPHERSPEEITLVSNENASASKVDAENAVLPIALVIESIPCMAEILRGYSWKCEAYHPKPLLQAHMQQVVNEMNAGKFQFMWIRRPRRDDMTSGRRASFERACMKLMFQAEAKGIFAAHCSYLHPGKSTEMSSCKQD